MSDCCASPSDGPAGPRRHRCPADGREYGRVSPATIRHHLREPWTWDAADQGWYFCDSPQCDAVYFGEDGSVLGQPALRTTVGIKQGSPDAPVCYCFGVSAAQAATDPAAKAFVVAQTKAGSCACEVRNPSGRCCLAEWKTIAGAPARQAGAPAETLSCARRRPR